MTGYHELRVARRASGKLYWSVGIFSAFANILMLTGPLYMLQVYDRVLGSGSEETLVALSILVIFLYGVMGILDYTRGRVMARVGARFQSALDERVFDVVLRKSATAPDARTQSGLMDLEAIQRLLTSPLLMAFFDLPWTPIFIAGIFLFHPLLGWLAVAGSVFLIAITLANQLLSKRPQLKSAQAAQAATRASDQFRTDAEMIQAMGMRTAALRQWQHARRASLAEQIKTTDVGGGFTSLTKTVRLLLQSAMLGLGAYLVLQNEMTAGAMIAGSIMLGRALAPIELMLGQWQLVQRAQTGWHALAALLSAVPPERPRTDLPKPKARLVVKSLIAVPPGESKPALANVGFDLPPGYAMGVIGPSGSGKSTLARCLTGVWAPARGSVRLDAASLDQYAPDVLGTLIGYLPQRVHLFDGTVGQNIARLSANPDAAVVVAAAKKANAHEMILALPDGYDTQIDVSQQRLSGGQIQRIGLARALYGDPVILILDEPNSNLDNAGSQALNTAIREAKADQRSVIIMAHRPAAIQECDLLLVLENGKAVNFGPKDKVLETMVKNHRQIRLASTRDGGVT